MEIREVISADAEGKNALHVGKIFLLMLYRLFG